MAGDRASRTTVLQKVARVQRVTIGSSPLDMAGNILRETSGGYWMESWQRPESTGRRRLPFWKEGCNAASSEGTPEARSAIGCTRRVELEAGPELCGGPLAWQLRW